MPAVRTQPIRWFLEPRPGREPRKMALLSDADAAAWSGIAQALAPRLEARLGPGILANRAAAVSRPWRLRPLGPALGRARASAAHLGRRFPLLVATDVRSFYPSVGPEAAHRSLRRLGVGEGAAAAAGLLEAWGSEGYAGLPIGPRASAVVANAVLAPVDEALRGIEFLRWVDDYLIGVWSERHARLVLERLDEALERVRLRRSLPKTRPLARGAAWLGAGPGPSDLRAGRA